MRIMKASVFKAKCLKLMEEVNQTGEEIVITKNGKPISKLVPYRTRPKSLFGFHEDRAVSSEDLMDPFDFPWDIEQ